MDVLTDDEGDAPATNLRDPHGKGTISIGNFALDNVGSTENNMAKNVDLKEKASVKHNDKLPKINQNEITPKKGAKKYAGKNINPEQTSNLEDNGYVTPPKIKSFEKDKESVAGSASGSAEKIADTKSVTASNEPVQEEPAETFESGAVLNETEDNVLQHTGVDEELEATAATKVGKRIRLADNRDELERYFKRVKNYNDQSIFDQDVILRLLSGFKKDAIGGYEFWKLKGVGDHKNTINSYIQHFFKHKLDEIARYASRKNITVVDSDILEASLSGYTETTPDGNEILFHPKRFR